MQPGSPTATAFAAPRSPLVAALLGIANSHHGITDTPERLLTHGIPINIVTSELPSGTQVAWSIRPEHIALDPDGPYTATLLDDAVRELTIALDGTLELTLRTYEARDLAIGAPLTVSLPPERVNVWPAPIS